MAIESVNFPVDYSTRSKPLRHQPTNPRYTISNKVGDVRMGTNLNTSSTNSTGGVNRVADSTGASSVLVSSNGNSTSGNSSQPREPRRQPMPLETGVSFTESTDYRTTSTDERRDNSRLPVTDATNVRVTSSNRSKPKRHIGQYCTALLSATLRFASCDYLPRRFRPSGL